LRARKDADRRLNFFGYLSDGFTRMQVEIENAVASGFCKSIRMPGTKYLRMFELLNLERASLQPIVL